MNISTKQLKGFALAAQFGSFTKAAEQLHVTQAGLSAIIRALEVQLGARLFDRTTRTLVLTEAGRNLLPVATRTLAELEAAATQVLGITSRRQRILRVGATPLVASRLLPAACAALHRQDPGVTIQVVEIQRDAIQEQVLRGDLDLGLGIFLAPTAGITRRKLFSSRLFCVAPAGISRTPRSVAPAPSMRWSGLKDTALVTLQPSNPVQQLIDRYLPDSTRSPVRYAVNHMETQIAMSEIGLGCAVIPSFALPACRSYDVDIKSLKDPVVELDFYGIIKSGRGKSHLVDRFTETLMEILKPMLRH
jgi:DNA-binding transcriptional LysR family regulator